MPAFAARTRNRRIEGLTLDFPSAYCLVPFAHCFLCIPCGLKASFPSAEAMEAGGSILFRNVKIEPAEKGRSLNSRPTWP